MDSIYSHYASALLSIAKEERKVVEYKLALIELSDYFDVNEDIVKFLDSYFVEFSEKEKVVDIISSGFKLNNLSNFLKLLIKKHRFNIFDKIVKEFVEISNEELNVLEGIIYSTIELNDKEIKKLEKAISERLNQEVELKNRIDPSLIGGIKITISDHVFDGSIKGKLESLKLSLKERRE